MIHVSEAISDYLDSKRPPRKSHGGLSVSNVSNGCPRSVWHELQTGEGKTFDATTKKKFEFGHLWESVVLEGLKRAGYEERPREVVNFGTFEIHKKALSQPVAAFKIDADTFDGGPAVFAARDELTGHPDHVVAKDGQVTVVEVKTTHLFGRPHPETVEELLVKQGQYVLQTVAYAKAYNAKAVLHVIDRSSGVDKDYELDVERYWPLFLARWEKMLPALGETEPEIDVPAWTRNATGKSYLCIKCPAKKCSERRA